MPTLPGKSALTLLLLLPLSLSAQPAAAPATEGRKPNVVIIHADDLGWGDLSCYGQAKFKTPHLDRMAAEGMRFTDYYAGSTVCAPSRGSLMTGRHTGRAWVRGNGDIPLRPEDVTVAEVLKGAGYATAVMGKWGLGKSGTEGMPDRQGFDEHFGWLDHKHPHRQYSDHLWRNGAKVPTDAGKDYSNDLVTEAALDFIRRNRERPFFLYLAPATPHAEMRVPEDSLAEFRGRYPETPYRNPEADARPADGYRSQATPHAATAAMIARLDRDVGRVLALLKELGIDGGTAVLFTSDNGPHKEGGRDPAFFASYGPFRGIKRDLYEGGIRVPMIARWPGTVPAGATTDHVGAHWDILPTAAAIAGASAPAGTDGVSLLPTLQDGKRRDRAPLYWEFHERGFQQAARMGDWKAVRLKPDAPIELYDLKSDQGETRDVAAKRPAVVAEAEAFLRAARTDSERWPVAGKRKRK